jgi:hypothetical protein
MWSVSISASYKERLAVDCYGPPELGVERIAILLHVREVSCSKICLK